MCVSHTRPSNVSVCGHVSYRLVCVYTIDATLNELYTHIVGCVCVSIQNQFQVVQLALIICEVYVLTKNFVCVHFW